MKKLFLFFLVLISLTSFSQTVNGDRIVAKGSLYLRDWWIDSIQRDTAFMNHLRSIPTSEAVRQFVEGRINSIVFEGGGGPQVPFVDSLYRSNDTIYWRKSGRVYSLGTYLTPTAASALYATQQSLTNESNNIRALIKATRWDSAIVAQSFDTTTRVLTYVRLNGSTGSFVIPRGAAGGADGIAVLSNSVTADSITIYGDNGAQTTFSRHDPAKLNVSDTTGKWQPKGNYAPQVHTHNIADVNELQFTLNSKASLQVVSDSANAINARKQDKLVSGVNIKTINGTDITGPGNINIAGGGSTPANYANSYFDDGKTGTYNGLAQVSEDGNTIYNLLDNNTGELTTWTKVTKFLDGSDMIDSKVDGVVYRKKGVAYYKRVYEGPVQASWYLKPGTLDNTASGESANGLKIQKALDLLNAAGGGVLEFRNGDYYFTPTPARRYGFILYQVKNITLKGGKDSRVICGTTNMGAYNFIYVYISQNITIDGLTLIGDRETNVGDGSLHADGSYYGGESGMGVYIDGSKNVAINDVHAKKFWGDGFYIGNRINYNIRFDRCVADSNRRNGLTATWVDGLQISNSVFNGQYGTSPQAGIDLEPNEGTWVKNVVMTNNVTNGNKEGGFTSSSDDVNISGHIAKYNGNMGIAQAGLRVNRDKNTGFLLTNADVSYNGINGVLVDGGSGQAILKNVITNGNGSYMALKTTGVTAMPQVGDIYKYTGHYTFEIALPDSLPAPGDVYQIGIYQLRVSEVQIANGYMYLVTKMANYPSTFPLKDMTGTLTKVSGLGKSSYTSLPMRTAGELELTVAKVNVDTVFLTVSRAIGSALPPVTGGTLVKYTGAGDATINYTSYSKPVNTGYGIYIGQNANWVSIDGAITLNNLNAGFAQKDFGNFNVKVNSSFIAGNGNGISLYNNNGHFTSNTVTENDNIAVNEGAVTVFGNGWNLTDNKIFNNQTTGVYVLGENTDIRVNTIEGNSQGADQTYDNITIGPNVNNTVIQTNTIRTGRWLNKPRYGVFIRDGNGDNNAIAYNFPIAGNGKSGDVRINATGTNNLVIVPSLAGGSTDLTNYLKLNGRPNGQSMTSGTNSGDSYRISTNPAGNGKIYLGRWNNRNYYDELTGNFSLDSNRLFIDGTGTYIGKFYDNNTQKLKLHNAGTILTGTQGGWEAGYLFEDYLHKNIGGFFGYGTGQALNYFGIGKNRDTAWLKVSAASTEITNKLRLSGITYSNNPALKLLVQDTASGDVYHRDMPDYSLGTQPEQFGADNDSTTRDDQALQAAINAAGPNGIIQLRRGATYLIKSTLRPLEGQTIYGYGARLKSANQVVTTTSTAISAGTSPTIITVASAAGLEVGMEVTVTNGPNMIDGDYHPHAITAINGNQITVSVPFTKSFPSGGTLLTHHGIIDGTGGSSLDRIKIYGVEIDGNRLNNLGYAAWQTNYLIYLSGAGVVVRDCYLHDGQSDGIMLGGTGSTVDNNRIIRMGGNGIHLSGVNAAKITKNYIDYCTLSITGTDNGSGSGHSEGTMTWSNLVSNTLVEGNYMAHARAMLGVIDGTDNNDNTITNNTGADFILYTVEFKDATGVDNNSLKNFIFSNNRIYRGGVLYFGNISNSGWAYDAANRSFKVAGNLLDHTGIEIWRGKDFTLTDNTFDFKGDSTSTILYLLGSSNASIDNNTILHGHTGMFIQGVNPGTGKDYIGSDISLSNNRLRDQYSYAMRLYGEQNYQYKDVTVSDNKIIQTRDYLSGYIAISAGNGVLVESNKLNLISGKYGIECLGDLSTGGYGVVGTTARFNWVKTPAGVPSFRIGGGTARNVVEMNAIYNAISNGQPANNFVQSNVYDTLAVGYSSTAGGATAFDALTDVDISGKANGSIPKWNSATLKWEMGVDNVGSSAPVWGTITGTLSSQTDLQNALNAKENAFTKNTGFNKNFGTTAGTVAAGDDSRISNGQTAFGWGNHAGLYPLLTGSYANPAWITSLAWGKITGAPSFATVATTGSYNDLIDKPTIPTYTANSMGTSGDGFSIYDSQAGNQFNFRRIYPGVGIEMSVLPNGNGVEIKAPGASVPAYSVATATVSADYTVPAGGYMVKLPDLTISGTNRNIILPDANANQGKAILIINANNTSTVWVFSGATVKDIQNGTITNVPNNAATTLVADGVNWIKTY